MSAPAFSASDEVFSETAERGLAAYLRHVGGDPDAAEA